MSEIKVDRKPKLCDLIAITQRMLENGEQCPEGGWTVFLAEKLNRDPEEIAKILVDGKYDPDRHRSFIKNFSFNIEHLLYKAFNSLSEELDKNNTAGRNSGKAEVLKRLNDIVQSLKPKDTRGETDDLKAVRSAIQENSSQVDPFAVPTHRKNGEEAVH